MEQLLRQRAESIWTAAIRSVLPDEAVRRALEHFHPQGRVFLVAAGKAAWQMAHAALAVLGLPCALGYNVWSGIQPLGAGSTVLDFEDFLVSNILLPGGSLVYLLFCVTKWGWGFDKYTAECNTGSGPKMPQWVKPYFKYVLPVLIAVILVQGLL